MPIVTINEVSYTVPAGTPLREILAKEGIEMPCGGHGRCGKCKVMAQGALNALTEKEQQILSREETDKGIRLACLTVAEGDCCIHTVGRNAHQIRVLQTGYQTAGNDRQGMASITESGRRPSFQSYGCAVDIGTTTLAACLYHANGEMLAQAGSRNPQAGWGADVISRIDAALNGAARDLAVAVCKAVDDLLIQLAEKAGISAREIDGMVITGNTVMLHLLTETSLEPLSHAPFSVQRRFGETVTAGSLGLTALQPDTEVYLPPCISAFVGADLVTALLSSGICETDCCYRSGFESDVADTDRRHFLQSVSNASETDECGASGAKLLVDIGTNGEMALVQEGQLLVCSTAAGPAFEGAGISQGMQGKPGAIDRVSLQDGILVPHVIGEAEAVGICGSGVVDAVACLLESGQIDETGYMEVDPSMEIDSSMEGNRSMEENPSMEEVRIRISPSVWITQKDVRMVQMAKSAIHAGIRTLLHLAGINYSQVEGLYIAGGFGSYLDVENAGRIGLIPRELTPKVHLIGNAALNGAVMLLLNREYRRVCEKYVKQAKHVELSNDPFFSEEYMEKMMF